MAITFGNLIEQCQVALGATDATTTSQIKWGIVRAIDSYKSQRFSWNRIKWELTTTAADAYYSSIGQIDSGNTYAAKEVFSIDSAFYQREDARRYKMQIVDFEVRGLGSDSTEHTGHPCAFSFGAQEFLVFPTPDDEYVIQGVAVVDVNKTSSPYTVIDINAADAALSPWFEHADRMIQCKALAEVFMFYRRDPKWAAVYEGQANQEFQRHAQDYERREGAGRIEGYYGHREFEGYWRF